MLQRRVLMCLRFQVSTATIQPATNPSTQRKHNPQRQAPGFGALQLCVRRHCWGCRGCDGSGAAAACPAAAVQVMMLCCCMAS